MTLKESMAVAMSYTTYFPTFTLWAGPWDHILEAGKMVEPVMITRIAFPESNARPLRDPAREPKVGDIWENVTDTWRMKEFSNIGEPRIRLDSMRQGYFICVLVSEFEKWVKDFSGTCTRLAP